MMATHTKCRVLIVEDDDDSRHALTRLLQRIGHETFAAATATAGIAAIIERIPEFLLLDLMLPDVNGVEVLRTIRAHGWPIKVAVVTATHDPHNFPGLMELDPDAVFPKPLNFAKLVQWLNTQED